MAIIRVSSTCAGISTSFDVPLIDRAPGHMLASGIAIRDVRRGQHICCERLTYVYNPYGAGIAFGDIEIRVVEE